MQKLKQFFTANIRSFSSERIACRLFAAWCVFIAYRLFENREFTVLEYAQNTPLWYMFLFVALLFVLFTFVNLIIADYETDSWFLMLGATVSVLHWLFSYKDEENSFLFAISVAMVYSLFAVYFVYKNDLIWKKWQPGNKTVWTVAIICGAFCGLVIGAITCYRHLRFAAPNFDFGLFVNMFHNMKKSGLPLSTSERDILMSHFAVHLSPIYYLLLPFYMVFPSPLTLQIGQAVVLASGIAPVVLLCKHFKISGKITILVSFIYSLYPAVSVGCFFDIHENCFLTPLLLWVFYFFEKNKAVGMYVFAVLTLLVKEDAAIYLLLFALYVIISKKRYYDGAILAIGSIAYFAIALSILGSSSSYYAELYSSGTPNPPISGPMIDRFSNLIYNPSDGLIGAVKTALLNPGYLLTQLFTTSDNSWGKLLYFIKMLLPLGFIPFFTKRASRWLLVAPILMNLLTNYKYQYNLKYQYSFGITAFLIYAVITNLPDFKPNFRRNVVSIAAVACCFIYITSVFPTFNENYTDYKENRDKYIQMEEILDTIPDDASVCCSTFLLSHLADRDEVYELYYHNNEDDIDYVIFDTRKGVDNIQLNTKVMRSKKTISEC